MNNKHFFRGICDHKDRFRAHAVLLLFEEIPVAHTGFPIRIPEGSQKKKIGLQSPSSKFQRRNSRSSILNSWLRRHTRGLCSKFRDINKTNGWRRSDDLFFQSAPAPNPYPRPKLNSTATMERVLSYNSYVGPARQRHQGSSQKPPFSRVIAGQNTASVLRVTGRNRTLWLSRVKLNHPLCFISSPKINSPSSIAQKGSISKPCPLPLEPGPFVSGQGVRRLCPSARRPDSGQTGPSCRCTQQISGLNGRVGTSNSAV